MKRNELRSCDCCKDTINNGGQIMFYKIKVTTMGLDPKAINQQAGLEQYFGGGPQAAALADVMGPDPDIAKEIHEGTELLICFNCLVANPERDMTKLLRLIEQRNNEIEEQKQKN